MKARSQGWRWKAVLLFTAVLCSQRAPVANAMGNPNERYRFDIHQGVAAWRLNDFGTQSGMQLLFNFEDMKGVSVSAVAGDLKPFDALDRMIKGTDIRYEFVNRRTVTLTRAGPGMWTGKVVKEKAETPRHGTGDRRASEAGLAVVTVRATPTSNADLFQTGSSIIEVSRADLDAAGFVSAQGAVRTLPQVFGGGPTEDTFNVGTEAKLNTTRGSGINLRGLGAASTLVLLNGRRIPGSGTDGIYADISNLPFGALERIDILPDSSSTLYGSDAVGGVVNFVMRDSFEGRQTDAYFSNSTRSGSYNENYISQLIGLHTQSGHGLLAMDFYSHDNLPASKRDRARSDLRQFGGSNFDILQSNPGNIIFAGSTWAIPHGQDGTALTAADFSKDVPANTQDQFKGADILLEQQRWTVFGTWRQELPRNLSWFTDVMFGQRDVRGDGGGALGTFVVPTTNGFYVTPVPVATRVPFQMRYNFLDDLGPTLSDARVASKNVTTGLEWSLGGGWKATGTFGYGSENVSSLTINQVNAAALNAALARSDRATAFNPFGDGSHTSAATLEEIRGFGLAKYASNVTSGGLLVRGPLKKLPGGNLTLSFGGDARKQEFRSSQLANTGLVPLDAHADRDRNIRSAFTELQVPLVGASNRIRGVEALTVSLAERYENYSDFGQSFSSRFGLSWAPMAGLTVRGSYSESFRPPGLLDLDETRNSYGYANQILIDPRTGKPANVLLWGGKNRELKEETASSWTAGLQYEPLNHPRAVLALTYFSTNFSNRLSSPAFSTDLLSNPALAPLVTFNPSATYRAEVCSRAPQSGNGSIGCLAQPVAAIVDLRTRNDAIVHTQGVDATARYALLTEKAGHFNFTLNGTYIARFAEAKSATLPLVNEVSTQNHPINLKLRGSMGWLLEGFEFSGSLNYYNHYKDETVTPSMSVASWTTLDLRAAYTLNALDHGWLGDTTFALGIENVFDRDPPFLNNGAAFLGYDQENGDLRGRMVSFTVRQKW